MASGIYIRRTLFTETSQEFSLSLFLPRHCLTLQFILSSQYSIKMDDDGTPLLSGFGQSRFIDHRWSIVFVGSARYMAPELIPAEPVVFGEDPHETYENQSTPNLTK